MAKKANEIVQINVRGRRGLLDKLKRSADENQQSLNAEVINRLEGSFDEKEDPLDIKSAISFAAGSDENGALLMMIASALNIASLGPDAGYRPEVFAKAVAIIAMKHANKALHFPTEDEVLAMSEVEREAHIMADVILRRRGYAGVIPRPDNADKLPLLSGLAQYFSPPAMKLADLGKPQTLADLGKDYLDKGE